MYVQVLILDSAAVPAACVGSDATASQEAAEQQQAAEYGGRSWQGSGPSWTGGSPGRIWQSGRKLQGEEQLTQNGKSEVNLMYTSTNARLFRWNMVILGPGCP